METTEWDVVCDPHGEDSNGMTNHVNFFIENIALTREVKCFPKSKPWTTSELKASKKKRVFNDMRTITTRGTNEN